MNADFKIRSVKPDSDAPGIAEIYNHHVARTTVSFDTEPMTAGAMSRKLALIAGSYPCLVCEHKGIPVGFAYAHTWKDKPGYLPTAETTLYVAERFQCQGIGSALLRRLIDECRTAGLHVLIACITADNDGSCRLHERFGFRRVSHFNKVGFKLGSWLDIVDYQLTL